MTNVLLHTRHVVIGFLAAVLTLAGCTVTTSGTASQSDSPGSGAEAGTTVSEPLVLETPEIGSGNSDPEAFPVTIDHTYGETEIPAPPQRIVVLGEWSEAEVLPALGAADRIVGIGIAEWAPEMPPWVQDAIGEASYADIEWTPGGVESLEQVAATAPDLIFAMSTLLPEEQYEQLSAIAPTIARVSGQGPGTWILAAEVIGDAMGMQAEVAGLLDEVENSYDKVVAAYPGLQGKTAMYAIVNQNHVTAAAHTDDPTIKILAELGLTLPTNVATLPKSALNEDYAEIPTADIGKLDADLLIMGYPNPETQGPIEADAGFQDIAAVKNGGYVVLDVMLDRSMQLPSVISIPWMLNQLSPALFAVAGS